MAVPASAPRVLVADDQADVLAALHLLLRAEGFDADSTTSVQGVRDHLTAGRYDLLLMDLNYARDTTSGLEGLALIDEVHARDGTLPIIVMTGWGSIETAVEAMRRGARTFVQKPWDNSTLAETVRREVSNGVALREARARDSREVEDARAIQRALLPSPLPPLAGGEIAALWQPATAFGGDCYDAVPLPSRSLGLSIADVAGKGLPAALVMANLQASLRAVAGSGVAPREVAARLNQGLRANAGLDRFVTFFYAVIDNASRTLSFSNAGHNPPILVHADGSVDRLSTGGLPLGVFPDSAYAQRDLALAPGDRLLLFTDGITEAQDADGRDFGDDRLVRLVVENRRDSAGELVAGVFRDVSAFTGGAFVDDATIVAVAIG